MTLDAGLANCDLNAPSPKPGYQYEPAHILNNVGVPSCSVELHMVKADPV